MKEPIIMPQILFSGIIKRLHNEYQNGRTTNFNIPIELLKEQFEKVPPILTQLQQKDGTIFCWFQVEDSIKKQEMIKIERQLESLLEEYFSEEWDVEAVLIPTSNQASFEKIRFQVDSIIHKIFKRFPFENFTQIVGFGDIIPYQAIFMEAISQFGNRYSSLYYENNEILLSHTETEPNMKSWTKEFRDLIMDHDYQTALELLSELNQTQEVAGIKYLLQMMIDRFNFAFEDALGHLAQAKGIINHPLLDETSTKLSLILSEDNKTRDMNRIIELYRQLDVYLDLDDTTSFLIRFYRAREAVLFYLLHHAQTEQTQVHIGKKSNIYQVIEELEQKYDNWEIDGYYGTYFYLKSQNVARTLNVRNQSFIGHARSGIDKKELWHSYFGTSKTTIEKAKKRFMMDTTLLFRDLGILLDENIIDINQLLLQLVSDIFSKGQNV